MSIRQRPCCFVLVSCLAWVFAAPAPRARAIDFAHDVLPILKSRCAKCHTNGTYKGDLSLDTREALLDAEVLRPGQADMSELILRLTTDDPQLRMPLNATPLTTEEVSALRRWIDEGAAWQDGFSFANQHQLAPLAPREVALPSATGDRPHPVDRLVDQYFAEYELPRPESLSDAAFARRAHLDLIGLLPSPEVTASFSADQGPNKRKRLVADLLARNRPYAEHWLSFWNDLLRNDYAGTGYIDGGRKQISRWLYDSLLANKPYDQLVRELVAPTAESEGFVRGIKWRGRVNASQTTELQFARNTAQVFLGINLKCASCHDSFIDSWKLRDAYGLAAVVSNEPLEIYRCDKPTGDTAEPRFLFPELGRVDPAASREDRLRQVAKLLTSPDNGRLARTIVNRLWQRLMGRGIIEPVDMMDNRPFDQDLLDWLAWDLAEHGYDLKRTISLICTSQVYQSACVAADEGPSDSVPGGYVFRGPVARPLSAEQFVDAVWQMTGTTPGDPAVDFGDRGQEPVRAGLTRPDLLQRSLGRPNREQVVTTRPNELTMLVALELTNGEALASLLDRGAENIIAQHPDWSTREISDWLWRAALCRRPTESEQRIAAQLVGTPPTRAGVSDLMWTVFMLPEFQIVR